MKDERGPLEKIGPITSKKQGFELYSRGAFGNMLGAWTTVQELEESGYEGLVNIRRAGKLGGQKQVPPTPAAEVPAKVRELVEGGIPPHEIRFTQTPPYHKLKLTGEARLSADEGTLILRYSRVREDTRIAFAQDERHATGLVARAILQDAMDDSSLVELMELLAHFEVVEFWVFRGNVGTVPHRNTVWSEVRDRF